MSTRRARAGRVLAALSVLAVVCAGATAAAGRPDAMAPARATGRPVVIDTDMSADDWMAILFLLHRRDVSVKAITVSGTGVAHGGPGARNAIRLLDLEGTRSIPVARGRATTYPGGHAFPDTWRPALDVMLGIELPPPSRAVSRLSAAELITKVAARSPVEILELGPPTNVADALRATPGLRRRVTSITQMGGALSVPGNAPGDEAEWNVYADPVAADIVLRSGIPWTLVPLDATNAVPYNEQFFKRLGARPRTAAARFVFDALSRQMSGQELYFWDPFGAAVLVDPSVATLERRTIRVVKAGADAGRTVEARNGTEGQVALQGSQERFEEVFIAALNAPVAPRNAAPTAARRWTNTGPEGGWVGELAIHPQAPRVVYASSSEGLFRSGDGGASWSRRPAPGYLSDLALDPQDPQTVFAVVSADVYRTQDGAASWVRLPLSMRSPVGVARIAVSPSSPHVIYAVSYWSSEQSGVWSWSSVDGGLTWVQGGRIQAAGRYEPAAFVVDPARPTTLYVQVRAKGLFRSDDGGKAWASADAGLPRGTLSSLAVDPAGSGLLYAGDDGGDVFRSADHGTTWTAAARRFDGSVSTIAVSAADGAVYAGTSPRYRADRVETGGGAVYRSADGRPPWRRAHRGLTGWYVAALAPATTKPGRVLAATEHGIFVTRDGGAAWTARTSGLLATSPAGLAVDPANPRVVYAAVERGISVSRDGGRTWRDAFDVRGTRERVGSLLAVPGRPKTIYATKSSQAAPRERWALLRSTDAGRTWATAGMLPGPIGALVADTSRPATIYGIGGHLWSPRGGVYKSVDGGRSWRRIYSARGKAAARALAVDPQDADVLYAGLASSSWKGLRYPLLKSDDGGRTWRRLEGFGPGHTLAVAVDPRRRGTVYAVGVPVSGMPEVRVSRDGGLTWAELGRTPSDAGWGSLLVDPVRPGVVYVGTWNGVSVKLGGAAWRSAGPAGGWTFLLATDARARRLYAGIAGRGVAATHLPLVVR